jgi:hypothetical protein
MNELTDLQICQRIAEIEGIQNQIEQADTQHPYIYSEELNAEYDPLTDDALCFKLMIKYDIAPFKCEFGGYECVYDVDLVLSGSGVVNDENPNRAICIAIIHLREK